MDDYKMTRMSVLHLPYTTNTDGNIANVPCPEGYEFQSMALHECMVVLLWRKVKKAEDDLRV